MDMEFLGYQMTGLSINDRGSSRGRMGRRRLEDNENKEFKSKNLHAERRRRQKLSDRLLTLRSVVPIITNMSKATIIEDAITYIQELQKTSQVLIEQLREMEGSSVEGTGKPMRTEIDAADDMKKCGIKEEVKVTNIDGNMLLIKIILEKKRGCFTKLIEAMNYLGFDLCETSVTTFKGAMLFSSSVQGTYGDTLMIEQTQELLIEIIRSMRDCPECATDESLCLMNLGRQLPGL